MYIKSSRNIVWELGAVLKSKGNLPIWSIAVCGYKNALDTKFICENEDGVGEFLGRLFDISLSKFIRLIEVTSWITGQHCSLTVWVEDSDDGRTNIDADVIEAFSELKWAKQEEIESHESESGGHNGDCLSSQSQQFRREDCLDEEWPHRV